MARAKGSGLEGADPRVGQTLRFEGQEWEVTDHSSYWNDAGYRVTEWCCETEDVEAYLLKEVKEGEPTRWFFTRRIDRDGVKGLPAKGPSPAPPTLTYGGQAFQYAETTEGTYEDEPGERVPKTTWEYWDSAHQQNLAVEVWPDGRIDCYRGAYIEPEAVTPAGDGAGSAEREAAGPATGREAVVAALSARAASRKTAAVSGPGNPFRVAIVMGALVYVVPFFMGRPFDECLGIALMGGLAAGWLSALRWAPRAAGLALLAIGGGAWVFWQYPPLTTSTGVAMALVAPLVVAWGGRAGAARGRRPVVYAAAVAVALPALVVGLHRYFWYAPGPHALDQLLLALGPAALCGLAAVVLAGLALLGMETQTA